VLGDLPWAVDVNARPTTSIIGIAKVMWVELGEVILPGEVRRDAGESPCRKE